MIDSFSIMRILQLTEFKRNKETLKNKFNGFLKFENLLKLKNSIFLLKTHWKY